MLGAYLSAHEYMCTRTHIHRFTCTRTRVRHHSKCRNGLDPRNEAPAKSLGGEPAAWAYILCPVLPASAPVSLHLPVVRNITYPAGASPQDVRSKKRFDRIQCITETRLRANKHQLENRAALYRGPCVDLTAHISRPVGIEEKEDNFRA